MNTKILNEKKERYHKLLYSIPQFFVTHNLNIQLKYFKVNSITQNIKSEL